MARRGVLLFHDQQRIDRIGEVILIRKSDNGQEEALPLPYGTRIFIPVSVCLPVSGWEGSSDQVDEAPPSYSVSL